MSELDDDLVFGLRLADLADTITLANLDKINAFTSKEDGSPVTAIDRAVEDALVEEIAKYRPGDLVVGEESARPPAIVMPSPGMRLWLIDPIDQTRHYVRRNPEFATLLSLSIGDRVEVGIVSAPALNRRWWAARKRGAWRNNELISVSRVARIEDAYLVLAGHREWHESWDWEKLVLLLNRCCYPAGAAGGFLQHMLVAEGGIDVFLEPWGERWDHTGSSLIIAEAGGTATTLQGGIPRGGSFLASNGLLHHEALRHLVPRILPQA